ncbi:MAG: Plug domain-containing protein [Mucilaginibacter sp.]
MLNSSAQVIQEVQNSFNLYKQTALVEKIFVHTDKNVYLPGEIVWFKIYCVDGNDGKPLNLSKVGYIEVVDNNQNPVIQAKISLKNGIGSGSLYIPVSVNNGNYRLRAYTNWMKNFSPEFYFEKIITLVNPLKSPEAAIKETAAAYNIQFFPEGGNLVSGIASKVGFKAVGRDGNGVNVEGAIVDQHNDTVARFRSLKFGMGSFSFTPASNNTYKAVVKASDNAPAVKDLPEVNSQGYVMHLIDDGGANLTIEVKSNVSTGGNIYLFAHTGQTIAAAETGILNNGSTRFIVSKSVLGEGMSHFTFFNNAKQPVCERLYFKRPVQQLFIEAGADQQQYNLRKKVNVNVMAKDQAGKLLNADLSMAVYRIDSLQKIDRNDIVSYLWLSSNLKGSIESADYYLKNADVNANEALDNLLLTQGWRRFQWNQVLENKREAFNFLPEYDGHIITAKIINTETATPAKNVLTYLGIPGKRVQLYTARSDSSGRLLYNRKDFYGQSEIVDQTNTQIDSTYRIDILSPFSEQFSKMTLPGFQFNAGAQKALQEHSLGIQVLNIYSGNQIRQFYEPLIDSAAFYGHPYKSYKLDDYTRFTTMEEVMREYVTEENITRSKGRFHIKVLSDRGFLNGGDPLVILDGIPIFNIDKLFTVDPLKVRKLEVVPTTYFYGPSESVGIFSFTSYKGDLGGLELDPHAIVMDYEGMQLQREFYSPVYDSQAQAASRIPDFRNVLYWSPAVNSQGKGAVSFYTSDQPGKYVGVVQGITAKGQAGVQYFTFDVR